MNKAFDAIFQEEVDAAVVAKTSYRACGDRFRYQCLCCGEEVYLAAADSTERSPHFRHRKGNNDTECERYLGQPGAIESYVFIRRKNKERIGFCFNIERMTFEVCLYLTSDEMDAYAERQGMFCLYTTYYSQPFITIPISRSVIIPNTCNYYTVCEYSNDYYASFDCSTTKGIYSEVMKKNGKLNVYRANQRDEHYKQNTSDMLYTNTEYIAISESAENIKELLSLRSVEIKDDDFSFITANKQFYAVRFEIKYTDYLSKLYFQKYDFQIETSETLDILWPPVFTRDATLVCSADNIYILSSFDLIPHGNIDAEGTEIENCQNGIHKLSVDNRIMIYEKNVETEIVKEKREINEKFPVPPMIIHKDKYIIPDDYDYFLFDKNGCTRLIEGSKVYLSKDDKIIGYQNGHIKAYILGSSEVMYTTKDILNDILKYHPQSEPFDMDEFMDIDADETILAYLEKCYRCGVINSVAKRYIMEKIK